MNEFCFPDTYEVEIEKRKRVELRTSELDAALKKPKTTVVELRQLERGNRYFSSV